MYSQKLRGMSQLLVEHVEPNIQVYQGKIAEEINHAIASEDLAEALKHLMKAQFHTSALRTYVQSCLSRLAVEKGQSSTPSVLVSISKSETLLSAQSAYCKGIMEDISNCCYLSNKLSYDSIFA